LWTKEAKEKGKEEKEINSYRADTIYTIEVSAQRLYATYVKVGDVPRGHLSAL
jgi:hypothetical protein